MHLFTKEEIEKINDVEYEVFADYGRYPVLSADGACFEFCGIERVSDEGYSIVTQDVGCCEEGYTSYHSIERDTVGVHTTAIHEAVRKMLQETPSVADDDEIREWCENNEVDPSDYI